MCTINCRMHDITTPNLSLSLVRSSFVLPDFISGPIGDFLRGLEEFDGKMSILLGTFLSDLIYPRCQQYAEFITE